MKAFAASALLLVVAVAACGARGRAVIDATPPPDVAGISPCPARVPMPNAPCDPPATTTSVCQYATPGRPRCPISARCDAGLSAWLVSLPTPTCGTAPSPCPATFTLPEGTACPLGDLPSSCDYDEGRCACNPCTRGTVNGQPVMGTEWWCRRWDTGGPTCLDSQPLVGSLCEFEGQTCYYESGSTCVALGYDVTCLDGVWRVGPAPQPAPVCPRECLN